MNKFQQHLYNKLIRLTTDNAENVFFSDDVEFRGDVYRVFQYRMLSGIDVTQSEQLECRGTMFRLENDKAVELVSLAPTKFFNLNENIQTQNLDYYTLSKIMVKYDGSLMSTVKIRSGLYLKSKGRFESVMANDANLFLAQNPKLYKELEDIMAQDRTCNMEWVSPNNRIVLSYEEERLVPFNIRDNKTGKTILEPPEGYPELASIWAKSLPTRPNDVARFIDDTRQEKGIEGYVMVFDRGDEGELLVKLKTSEYVGLHRVMGLLGHEHSLFDLALEDKIDDAIGSLPLQPSDIKRFSDMKQYVAALITAIAFEADAFHTEHAGYTQKDLAIACKEKCGYGVVFSMVMNKFHTGLINYKGIREHLRREWQQYLPMPTK